MNLPKTFQAVVVEVTEEAVMVETVDTLTRGSTLETLPTSTTGKEGFSDAVGELVTVERYEYRKKPLFRVVD